MHQYGRLLTLLSFMVSLVGVGFDLNVLSDLGTSTSTSATYRVATLASISISSTDSCTLVSIAVVSVHIMFYKNSSVSFRLINVGLAVDFQGSDP